LGVLPKEERNGKNFRIRATIYYVVLSKEKIVEFIKSTPKERLEWLKMANRFVKQVGKKKVMINKVLYINDEIIS